MPAKPFLHLSCHSRSMLTERNLPLLIPYRTFPEMHGLRAVLHRFYGGIQCRAFRPSGSANQTRRSIPVLPVPPTHLRGSRAVTQTWHKRFVPSKRKASAKARMCLSSQTTAFRQSLLGPILFSFLKKLDSRRPER